jgi:mono/diheme cytochrome c family protein
MLTFSGSPNYSGTLQNQLSAISQAGYFFTTPPLTASLPRMVGPGDTSQSLEIRARSYLATNCAPCHQPGGGASNPADLRAHIALEDTGIIRGILNNSNGNPTNRIIVPGDVAHSMAVTRMQGGGGLNRMPPIGSNMTDTVGVEILTAWINSELPAWRSFAEWQSEKFGSSSIPEAAPSFDKDGDGRSNQMEYLVGSDPNSSDIESLFELRPSAGQTFEISVPKFMNRSVLIETSMDLSNWQLWNVPGNTPDYPVTSSGVKTLSGVRDSSSRFFRACLSAP